MKKRYKINKRKSRRLFSKTANKTHQRNKRVRLMRGGTRL